MGTTPLGIAYPDASSPIANLQLHLKQLADSVDAILGGPWSTYVPTIAGITIGNGTVVGRYRAVGKTVDYSVTIVLGNTSSVTNIIFFSPPVAPRSMQDRSPVGAVVLGDASTGARRIWFAAGGGTSFAINDSSGAVASNTNPWTWATGDFIEVRGTYEAA